MNEQHINSIINLFRETKVWNDGKFMNLVKTYCEEHMLNTDNINSKLQKAFEDYLATDIKSENAIRFRLSQLI